VGSLEEVKANIPALGSRPALVLLRPRQALAPLAEESLADGLAGRLIHLFV
jgi:hypothetical protein